MSSSEFTCPKCSTRFRVEDQFMGRVAACPKADCRQKMKLAPAVDRGNTATPLHDTTNQSSGQQSTVDVILAETVQATEATRDVDSAIRRKSAGPGSSVIGPRESGTERLARQNENARRRRAEQPKSITIHPAWYGAAIGLLVGGGVLYAWTVANPLPDLSNLPNKPSTQASLPSDDSSNESQ